MAQVGDTSLFLPVSKLVHLLLGNRAAEPPFSFPDPFPLTKCCNDEILQEFHTSCKRPCLSFPTEAFVGASLLTECLSCPLSMAPLFILPFLLPQTFISLTGSFCLAPHVGETLLIFSWSRPREHVHFQQRVTPLPVDTFHLS